ncbi:MAG: hypothetical protein AB1673_12195 [Actinomycetota bacterium]
MNQSVLVEPRHDSPTEIPERGMAQPGRSRKFLTGFIVSVLAPVVVTGVAWAEGCACG